MRFDGLPKWIHFAAMFVAVIVWTAADFAGVDLSEGTKAALGALTLYAASASGLSYQLERRGALTSSKRTSGVYPAASSSSRETRP